VIDLHCHLLPGVDDGAADVEEALDMARIAVADGIHTIVATPHMLNPNFDVTVKNIDAAHLLLSEALVEAEIPLTVHKGAEIHFDADIVHRLEHGEVLPLGGTGKTILLELPSMSIPSGTEELIFEVQAAGYTVVLAHPERNQELLGRPQRAEKLRDRGVLMQVTARSICGGFGFRPKRVSRKWLKQGLVDVIASDAHRRRGRVPELRAAMEIAEKYLGTDRAEAMVNETPARLLARE